jgi:hypothetical protein
MASNSAKLLSELVQVFQAATITIAESRCSINFVGEATKRFESLVDRLWRAQDELFLTVGKGVVQEHLTRLMGRVHHENRMPVSDDISQLFSGLDALPKETWEVFRALHGATVSGESPSRLGAFTLYNREKHWAAIQKQFPQADQGAVALWSSLLEKETLVSVGLASRDNVRARERADDLFRRFENVLRYLVSAKYHGTRGVDVGVFDYNEWTLHEAVALSESGKASGSTLTEGSGGPVPIDDAFYSDPQYGHDRLWALVSQDQRSQLENKILMAVEWTGNGSHDLDPAKSFVQFMFALEALCTFHEKVFVTPSIASQLAEFAAFVAGQDLDHRLQMARMVKDFYENLGNVERFFKLPSLDSQFFHQLDLNQLDAVAFPSTLAALRVNGESSAADWPVNSADCLVQSLPRFCPFVRPGKTPARNEGLDMLDLHDAGLPWHWSR